MLKNILVPVDGSEGSDRAVAEAIKLAEVCEGKLNFLYIANINQLAINACLSDVVLEAVTKAGNVILDRAMQMVPSGIKKEAFAETGSPAVAIRRGYHRHGQPRSWRRQGSSPGKREPVHR